MEILVGPIFNPILIDLMIQCRAPFRKMVSKDMKIEHLHPIGAITTLGETCMVPIHLLIRRSVDHLRTIYRLEAEQLLC